MDLYINVPIFTRAGNDELLARRTAFREWFTNNKKAIKDKYGFANINRLILSPEQVLKCVIDLNNTIEVIYPLLVPKGLAVRLHILTILDWIDYQGDPSRRDDSYYVMIDGSGAFDFSNIFLVLDKLCGIPKYDVVLGKRPPEESGMAKWRKNIELFEEYLIYKKFKKSVPKLIDHNQLPDSQAGCWGLRLSVMKHISLTGRNYELEYDLLVSSIENGIKIGFTEPLKMALRKTTDFGRELDEASIKQCVSKMKFIVHRLDFEKGDIPKLLDKYLNIVKQSSNKGLPELYIKEMKNFGLSNDI